MTSTTDRTDSRRSGSSPESAEQRFRSLVENAAVGIFQTEIEGRIVWINPAAARVAGYDGPEEMAAAVKDIRDIYVDPNDRDEFVRVVGERGSATEFEYRIRQKDGSIRWLSVSGRAAEFSHGVSGFEGTVVDITDRKLVEAAMAAISSGLDPHLAVTSFADVLHEVIPFVQLSLSVIEDDVYRRLVSVGSRPDRFPEDERVSIQDNAVGVVVETGEPVVVEDTRRGRFGYDKRLAEAGLGSYVILPLRGPGGVFGTFNIGFRDPDAPTPVLVASLYSVIGAIAQAVGNVLTFEQQRETIRRLEELDRLKDEFVATIAHDMRSPLATVVGLAQLLTSRWGQLGEDRRADVAKVIEKNAADLADFAEEVLDVAALDAGRFRFEIRPFDLGALVHRTAGQFRVGAKGRTIEVRVGPGLPPALGDERRTWQVLANLISNALKFSSPDDPVEIRAMPSSGVVEVTVRDRGRGIDPDDVEVVFERFTRVGDNDSENVKGAGLGLYICKSMVEAQGGRIWVVSEPEQGSSFTFTIPYSGPEAVS